MDFQSFPQRVSEVFVCDASLQMTCLLSMHKCSNLHIYPRTYAHTRAHTCRHIHMQRPGGALRALAVLRKPSCPRELVYRFAPALMADAPDETVDALVAANPPFEPRFVRSVCAVRACVCVCDAHPFQICNCEGPHNKWLQQYGSALHCGITHTH